VTRSGRGEETAVARERLLEEIAAAVREGRIDGAHAAILFRRGGPPTGDRGGD